MSKYYADVSHYHPVIDWAAAKKSCSFLISKATQGTTYVDTTLKQFISGCEKNKIPYWLYTYLNPGSEKAQVDFMLNTCKSLVGSYFIGYILDVEAGNAASDVSTALKHLESKGTKVMIYTGYADYQRYKDVISKKGANTAWWEARYGKNDGAYNVAYPCHSGVDLHQYTSKGATPFTIGSTDLNRLTGLKSESWFTTKLNTSQGIREVNRSEDKKKEAVTVAVKVGSARIDENGNAIRGKAGDQTGREVATEDWYLSSKGWVVLRAKDPKVAEKLAYAMERACANNNIGYDQGQRNTLYNVVKNLGFDPGKAVTKCETDCSALVRVCLAYAGIHVADYNTSNERSVIMATGKFEQRPDSESKASKYMKRGDILVTKTKGHTVIVLNNGTSYSKSPTTPTTSSNTSAKPSTPAAATPKQIKAKEGAKSFNKAYAKTYKTSVKCHIRNGAGTDKTSLGILPAGVAARCYGYYTSVAGTKWMYVVASNAGITYTAFISSKCLR